MATCPHCGTVNADNYMFCMSCGKPLQGAGDSQHPQPGESSHNPDPDASDLLDAGIVCPKCDTYNDPGCKICISCGESLSGLTEFLLPVSGGVDKPLPQSTVSSPASSSEPKPFTSAPPHTPPPDAPTTSPLSPAAQPTVSSSPPEKTAPSTPSPTPVPEPAATPSVAVSLTPKTSSATSEVQAPKRDTAQLHSVSAPNNATSLCPFCQAPIPADSMVCFSCGKSLVANSAPEVQPPDVSIRLRLVRGYGREDSTLPIGPKGVTIGRSQAVITIPQDPFLSPCHLKIFIDNGEIFCEDQGSLNGTFIRTRSNEEIKQGTEFITGNQRFYLMGLGGPTTDVRINASNDTRAYGGPPPRQLFVALRLHYASDQGKPLAGAVLLRSGPIITIGKRGCDLNFPGDPAMADYQCELQLRPSGIQLKEKGTSTGVFVKIKGKKPLKNGDELMVGDEVFRIEIG